MMDLLENNGTKGVTQWRSYVQDTMCISCYTVE